MRWLLASLALGACTPQGETRDLSQLAPPRDSLQLTLTGAPAAGQSFGWTVTGADPGEIVYLIVANGGSVPNLGACPAFLGGNCMDMRPGALGYTAAAYGPADAAGTWTLSAPFPAAVAPGIYQAQAVSTGPNANESGVEDFEVAGSCVVDPYEPNNSDADATPLAPAFSDGYLCAGEEDWFTYDVPGNGYVEVTISYDPSDGDLDAALYAPDGQNLDNSNRSNGTEVIAWFNYNLAPQTVYLRVYPFFDPNADGIPYGMLREQVTPGVCTDDLAEDDDLAATAQAWTGGQIFGTSCPGDNDWVAVPVAAGETLTASLSESTSAGDVVLRAYDEQLTLLTPQTVDDVSVLSAVDQTLFLEVELASDDGDPGNSYTLDLSVGVVVVCTDDSYEPDDTWSQRTDLVAGDYTGLTACVADGADWFGISLSAGDTVEIDARFLHADGDVDLYLRDPSGQLVAASDSATDDESVVFTAARNGRHRLLVALYADEGPPVLDGVDYDLSVTVR